MPTVSKRMKASAKKRPADAMPIAEAVTALKQYSATKFDQTVDIVLRLGVDAAQADQIVRGSIVLPHGIGKQLRVVVFAKGAQADAELLTDAVGQHDRAADDLIGLSRIDAQTHDDVDRLVEFSGAILLESRHRFRERQRVGRPLLRGGLHSFANSRHGNVPL